MAIIYKVPPLFFFFLGFVILLNFDYVTMFLKIIK